MLASRLAIRSESLMLTHGLSIVARGVVAWKQECGTAVTEFELFVGCKVRHGMYNNAVAFAKT